jgi:hypothetical protein
MAFFKILNDIFVTKKSSSIKNDPVLGRDMERNRINFVKKLNLKQAGFNETNLMTEAKYIDEVLFSVYLQQCAEKHAKDAKGELWYANRLQKILPQLGNRYVQEVRSRHVLYVRCLTSDIIKEGESTMRSGFECLPYVYLGLACDGSPKYKGSDFFGSTNVVACGEFIVAPMTIMNYVSSKIQYIMKVSEQIVSKLE